MANNIERFAVNFEDGWSLSNLTTNSIAFHNYLKSAVIKYVGTAKPYNRSLVKKISVASGESFMIKFTASKKSNTNLFITYILTDPDGEVVISSKNQEYLNMNEVEADFDLIDRYISEIPTYDGTEPEPTPVAAPKRTVRKTTK